MDATIDTNLKLIVSITRLGWGEWRFQQPVQRGRIAVLNIGGRVTDRHGQPLIFHAGDRPEYKFLQNRLYGIPGFGRAVTQEVIEFAEHPGHISVSLRQMLLGFSSGPSDPATVTIHTSLKLLDPIRLLNYVGVDVQNTQNSSSFDTVVTGLVEKAAATAISDKMQDLSANPSYLTAQDLGTVQRTFRTLLLPMFEPMGLTLVDSLPPSRTFPSGLATVLYQVRLGAVQFNLELERDRQRAMHQLGIREEQAQRLAALGPVAGWIDMANNNPQIAVKMLEMRGQETAAAAQIVRTILATQDMSSDVSKQLLFSVLQDTTVSQTFMPFGDGNPNLGGAFNSAQISNPLADIPAFSNLSSPTPAVMRNSIPTVVGTNGGQPAAPPAASAGTSGVSSWLDSIVNTEVTLLNNQPNVEVDRLGPKGDQYRLEVSVDNRIVYRLGIGLDFAQVGPTVEYVMIDGVRKPATDLPPWPTGEHLDALVVLARSGHFG
jgi:hypothetical protein